MESMCNRAWQVFRPPQRSPLGFIRHRKVPQGAVRIACKFNLEARFRVWSFITGKRVRILAARSGNKRRETVRPRNLIWSPVAENSTIGGAAWKIIPTLRSTYNPNPQSG